MDTLRILVTDDELGMRLGISRTLDGFTVRVPDVSEPVSFVVDQAASGEEALEKIAAAAPDILLLDHKMPGISGLDVLDRLAGMQLTTLTIMITAYASIDTAVTATKRGAYDFLAKPFTPDELKSTIRKAAARLVLAKQARRLEAEKRQIRFEFISVLGHELKAPLNAIAGYLDLIQKQTLGPEVAAYAEMVGRSLVRIEGMGKLIADLLDLTRIESGQKNRQLVRLDVVAAAHTALEAARSLAAENNVALRLHADAPVTMTGDACELEMVLNNLVSNAVKYNRPDGQIDVTLSRTAGEVVIQVVDTGIGLSPEEIDRLGGEFVRIKNDKTRNILGSGLGLSTVKKLVQLYDGRMQIESQPDVGSTFTVALTDPQASGG
jgi:two-component system, sensor histidine kinase and response regulator